MAKEANNKFFSSYLENFFYEELRNAYGSENLEYKELPSIQVGTDSPSLRMAIEEQIRITSMHITQLEEIFQILAIDHGDKNMQGIKSLFDETESILENAVTGTAKDVAIILSIKRILHYGIASYGGLVLLAKTLELAKVSEMLENILTEKNEADHLLSSLLETTINLESNQ